ncbi:MAG: lipid A deacylase LpxR family protein [Verrucomicrobiales bacterium]|nr:lipid A deacylase LpxR family protein [Verrucomicrobiales bacterium]
MTLLIPVTCVVAALAGRGRAAEDPPEAPGASDSGPTEATEALRSPAACTAVSLRWENDALAGRDEHYSNGVSLGLTRDGRGLLGGIWGWFGATEGRWITGYELGQIMVTPADISRPVPDPTDRPYAGLLYGALSTQYSHGNQFHGLKLITGVVGPASLAEETQKWVHDRIGSTEPQGWDYQLKNEPILNLVYEHRRRYTLAGSRDGLGAEVIPVAGAMLGNVLIQAQAGAQLRLGYQLPDDFGTSLMRGLGNLPFPALEDAQTARRRWGVYVFAGGSANLVARDLTLDGNSFRDGPHVTKEPFFAAGEAGISLWLQHFQTTFSYVIWGKEFQGQDQASQFAAVTASVCF